MSRNVNLQRIERSRSITRIAVAGLALAGTLAWSRWARADTFLDPDGIWAPVGVTLGGAATEDDPVGFVLGGEISVVDFVSLDDENLWFWAGGVADATWDFGRQAMRHRVGAEVGMYFFGLEVAYLGELYDGTYRPGVELRTTGNLPFFSIYGGYGHLFGEGSGSNMAEFGGSVKIPIPLLLDHGHGIF